MKSNVKRLAAAIGVCVIGLAATASARQTTSSTSKETKQFTVISVDGNKLVLRGAEGTKEFTVPDDFRFNVGGKQVSVSELHPGMKGTATITTTTTTRPVTVTEVRNGTVMQASGASIIVKTDSGIKMFSQGDVDKRGVKILKEGKPVDFSQLHSGDKLSATIVTEKAPQVMTATQVEATLSPAEKAAVAATTGSASGSASRSASPSASPSASRAASPSATAGAAPAAGAESGAGAGAKRTLPKTASSLPLVGVIGLMSLAIGVGLSWRRRSAQ